MTMLDKHRVSTRTIMQADINADSLQSRGATFAYTPDVPHDETMQKFGYFELFLATSALPRRHP